LIRWGEINTYRILVGKSLGKYLLGRRRRRYEDNIKKYLRDIGYEDGRWMELAQDRVQRRTLVLTVLNLGVLLPHSYARDVWYTGKHCFMDLEFTVS
jgi:hypothetical protein